MSARPDPLAVLDMAADWMDDNPNTTVTYSGDVRQARADIAALVEAARTGRDWVIGTGDGPDVHGLFFSPAKADQLRAALAPFGDPK